MVPSFIVFCLLSIECYQDPINSGTSNATSINENVIVSHACNTSAWEEYIYHYRLPGNETTIMKLLVLYDDYVTMIKWAEGLYVIFLLSYLYIDSILSMGRLLLTVSIK